MRENKAYLFRKRVKKSIDTRKEGETRPDVRKRNNRKEKKTTK